MKIDPIHIVREYYEQVKHLYPELEFKEFAEICYVPWQYTKHNMISGELPTIRLKFFGLFSVLPGKVKYELIKIKEELEKGYLPEKRYKEIKEMLIRYTKNEKTKSKN